MTNLEQPMTMITEQQILPSEIEITADGSHTLFVPSMDEHYHSVNGAQTEAEHIYINYGLRKSEASPLHVLEIGFGTGLNAFLTILEAQKIDKKVRYTSLELYPLSVETVRQLNYASTICPEKSELYYDLHRASWNEWIEINDEFSLLKLHTDYTLPANFSLWQKDKYDVIYFDAFAPEKQPEMWSQELFDALYQSTNDNGILMTYCAKGVVRRMLQSSGYLVERLPGPPGKREVLRATKHTV